MSLISCCTQISIATQQRIIQSISTWMHSFSISDNIVVHSELFLLIQLGMLIWAIIHGAGPKSGGSQKVRWAYDGEPLYFYPPRKHWSTILSILHAATCLALWSFELPQTQTQRKMSRNIWESSVSCHRNNHITPSRAKVDRTSTSVCSIFWYCGGTS